jgi:hypothetical protein
MPRGSDQGPVVKRWKPAPDHCDDNHLTSAQGTLNSCRLECLNLKQTSVEEYYVSALRGRFRH